MYVYVALHVEITINLKVQYQMSSSQLLELFLNSGVNDILSNYIFFINLTFIYNLRA